ncbi:MAG TPA: DNA polymerase III subunit delta [Alphaproteobacteria bacterium]|jgi:DNA polymerase-3 subunit delta|nr:DNA polymerase III subunit delta [Alphaproteobacteria bacterium]MCB9985601.1 DNA polymerase III subunit delta [Micavibrio sp.]HPQ50770.1 DNA polymerase III subunit delta [Alphaproteobacteria bacterium]HRK98257.1 DNA polymerase III subunit delta [Alphaproteobacteria bacterium]
MKLTFRQIEPFLKNPDPAMRAVLVYGPDQGMVRERAKILGLKIVSDLNDPFNAAHLTGNIIEDDPSRFYDEVNAQSLMGGTRLVRITDPGSKCAIALKDWLKSNPSEGTQIIIEGGDLRPRDAIRKICEESPNATAIPCYIQDERDMAKFLRDLLTEANRTAANDAINWLSIALKGDRGRARMEAEKLDLYKGSDLTPITLHEAMEACGDSGSQNLDDLLFAATGRNPQKALSTYQKLLAEDTELIVILRSLQNHIRRLHQVRCTMDETGLPIDMAIKNLQPPVFFKVQDSFQSQVNRFPAQRLRKMLARLNEIEADTKKTATPSETLVAETILKLASM